MISEVGDPYFGSPNRKRPLYLPDALPFPDSSKLMLHLPLD
jgi:hypothetical protein